MKEKMSDLGKTKDNKSLMYMLACASVVAYIASAVAFEMTAETVFVSTIAIYLVFAVGLVFILHQKIWVNEYVLFLLAFCAYVFVRVAATNSSDTTGMQIAYWELTCVVLCLIVFWMSLKYQDLFFLAIIAYIVGALILSIRIVVSYGGINEIIEYTSTEGENRVGDILGNANAIGLFLANGILCGLIVFIKNKVKMFRALMLITMIWLGTMLLLTGSRKSLAFAVLGIIAIIYFYYRKAKIQKKFGIYFILIGVLILVYIAITRIPMFSTIFERMELLIEGFFSESTSYETDRTRQKMIEQGIQAFWKAPIFGHGTGYSYELFGTYSHNNFVELLMNYGIIGFALYYIPYVLLFVKLVKQVVQKNLYATYFAAYIFMQVMLGVGWVNYYERSVQIITALAYGYIVSQKSQRSLLSDEV